MLKKYTKFFIFGPFWDTLTLLVQKGSPDASPLKDFHVQVLVLCPTKFQLREYENEHIEREKEERVNNTHTLEPKIAVAYVFFMLFSVWLQLPGV